MTGPCWTTSPPSSAPPSPIPAAPRSCSRAPAPARRGCSATAWRGSSSRAPRPTEILALTFTREAAVELRARAEEPHRRAATRRSGSPRSTRSRASWPASTGWSAGCCRTWRSRAPRTACSCCSTASDELDLRVHDLRGDRARLVADLVERIDKCRDQLVSRRAVPALGRGVGALGGLALGRPPRAPRGGDRAGARDPRPVAGGGGARGLRPLDRPRPGAAAGATPTGCEAARAAARHVLVDEFQDTNHAQAELLYLLAGDAASLVVVGDDDQGIYRFRGASSKNIADFRRRFPDAAELRLEVNHRSTQAILDAAAAVVAADPRPRAQDHRRAAGGRRAGPALLAGARPRRAGPRGGAGDPAAGRGGGSARGAGGADARGAPGGAAGHRGARARRDPPSGARRIRALRAARGARGGGLAARRGRSVRRPGAPAARLRPAPRPALDGGGRRGVGRRGPRRPGGRGARRRRPAGRSRRGSSPRWRRPAAPPPRCRRRTR